MPWLQVPKAGSSSWLDVIYRQHLGDAEADQIVEKNLVCLVG
jgi:hypothetical protein